MPLSSSTIARRTSSSPPSSPTFWSKAPTGLKMRSSAATSSKAVADESCGCQSSRVTRPRASSTGFVDPEADRPRSSRLDWKFVATSTSLNLRAVLKAAVARSGMDSPARVVSGLTSSAKALFVAAAAHAQPHAVVFYVVPGDGDVEEAVGDVEFFLAALEGLPAAASDRAVLPFPSHEIDPYRGLAPHVGVTSARARALHAIARGTARIVVASAAALLPRVTGPDRLLRASMDLKPGQEISPTDLAELLVDAGFTREDPADEHGEFAVRGGIVDIFPAGAARPVRLEFVGDTIETLRTYDPATQRSIAPT